MLAFKPTIYTYIGKTVYSNRTKMTKQIPSDVKTAIDKLAPMDITQWLNDLKAKTGALL